MKRIKLPRDHNHTTRCYPRTMREAFPNDADYSEYIDYPDEEISRSDILTAALSFILWVCLVYLFAN